MKLSTSRTRMKKAFEFTNPDRIPVVYHPSPAGLHVHGRRLLDLFNRYPPDNPITFNSIPSPPAGSTTDDGRYRETREDEWGTVWEYLIYGVHGHPIGYPFESWEDASDYRFPPYPFADRSETSEIRKSFLVWKGGVSIFERLHALRPFEEVLVSIADENPALLRFLDRLADYWTRTIHLLIEAGVDVISFGDDWGTQNSLLVSRSSFRRLFRPIYEKLMDPIHKAGRRIFFHSCGYLGGILDELIELGIHGLWPQISFFEADPSLFEKCLNSRVALYIHPDRQHLVPSGSPAEIEQTIRQYSDRFHRSRGGGIFYVEIENDAPFGNVRALIESIHRWR